MTSRTLRAMTVLTAAAALCATASTAYAVQNTNRRTPRIVTAWAHAWNGTDPQALGGLFTADGTYTDEAVAVTFRGPPRRSRGGRRAPTPSSRTSASPSAPPVSRETASPSGPSTPGTSRARPSRSRCS
ncbi:hypothetical protein GCM10020254_03330 [Streptomyces goshikiensis]